MGIFRSPSMMDDFYQSTICTDCLPQGLLSKIYNSIPIPPAILATLLLGPLLIFLTAQLLLIGAPLHNENDKDNSSWMIPFQPVPWRILASVRPSFNHHASTKMLSVQFFRVPERSEERHEKASEVQNFPYEFRRISIDRT